jgi:hypothetical protein
MEIVRYSLMLHKGDGMNGVNLKATGGLRVMNGAMAQCRSIKDFSFQASTYPQDDTPAICGYLLKSLSRVVAGFGDNY